MNFLKRLFGGSPNPTAEWPILPPATPVVDLRTGEIGPLRRKSPLSDARALGSPSRYTHNAGSNPDLLYAPAGFLLEYEENALVEATFFIGADEGAPAEPSLKFCKPTLITHDGTRHQLHSEMKFDAVERALGKPARREADSDEVLLEWEINGITIWAEFDEHQRLWKLSVFL